MAAAATCSSKQVEEGKYKYKDQPAAIGIVMLKKFVSKVPKYKKRRQMIKQGRIKTIYISKKADRDHVHDQIKATFGVKNFFVLDCHNGHTLMRSPKKFIDGKLAIKRRGCLYLCEDAVSYIHVYEQVHIVTGVALGGFAGSRYHSSSVG